MASLLLRLFHSDYFSPHLALSYLKTYSDNIGITYYLVEQLRSAFPAEEVEFYWPQLCYLLITRPSESRALESFVLQRCDESVHVALLTLWYFQAALSDLSTNPHTASFVICQRVFNACQRILFDDPLSSASLVTTMSTSSTSVVTGQRGSRVVVSAVSRAAAKVLPCNSKASIVGMGAVLASVPGMPNLAAFSGRIAIEQGRKKPLGLDRAELEGSVGMMRRDSGESSGDEEILEDEEEEEEEEVPASAAGPSSTSTPTSPLAKRSQTAPAQSLPSSASTGSILKTSLDKGKRNDNPFAQFASRFDAGFNELRSKTAAAVGDALGQTFGVDSVPAPDTSKPRPTPAWHPQRRPRASLQQKASRFRSVPNLGMGSGDGRMSPFSSTAQLPDSPSTAEAVLAQYDPEARRRLLRSNYCRMQSQFLLTLQDISTRLLLIPKPARLSALRAELTQLNHTLPAEVCFPLWCRAEAQGGAEASATKPKPADANTPKSGRHHRVVRINPSEAVVLNSADRVPFLLHVEVLHDDLDFDPDRRQNRESLKKLVAQEDARRRKFALSRNFAAADASREVVSSMRREDSASGREGESRPGTPGIVRPDTPKAAAVPEEREDTPSRSAQRASSPARSAMQEPPDDEEIDLTEQAYGADLGAFGEEREPGSSDEDDLTHYNRTHDTAAWTAKQHKSRQASNAGGAVEPASASRPFSLDEYSERMRTAAIMLAQLNQSTNAAAHPIVAHNPLVSSTAQGGWSSWLTGTSWAGGAVPGGGGAKSEVGQGTAGIKAPINGSTAPAAPRASTSGAVSEGLAQGLATAAATPGSSKVMQTDTEAIRRRIMQEMMALEEERMERMKAGGRNVGRGGRRRTGTANGGASGGGVDEDEETVLRAVNKDDPSAAMFRESWAAKKARIRASSPYGHLESWDVFSVIVKTGADLRQEQLAVQLISEFGRIWRETGSRCWVRYFRILVTSENSGLMETVTDAISVHSIKKEAYSRRVNEGKMVTYSLYDHFVESFGEPSSSKFNKARDRFMESLAAYSIISYLLQIKDRHNGNILIDGDGRLIHIDFGFMLGISPGGVGFEAAPFKLTQDYIDILGGLDSAKFAEFKKLVQQGFRDVRKHAERIIMMVELMQRDSKLPCFSLGELTASNLRDRFQLGLSSAQCDAFAERLVDASANSAFTRLYDTFQHYSQGVL